MILDKVLIIRKATIIQGLYMPQIVKDVLQAVVAVVFEIWDTIVVLARTTGALCKGKIFLLCIFKLLHESWEPVLYVKGVKVLLALLTSLKFYERVRRDFMQWRSLMGRRDVMWKIF